MCIEVTVSRFQCSNQKEFGVSFRVAFRVDNLWTERDHEESPNTMDGYIAMAWSNREIKERFSA